MPDSGVKAYLIGKAIVKNGFPIDFKGKMYVSCEHCRYYRNQSRKCGLTEELVPFPATHIGNECPFEFEEE